MVVEIFEEERVREDEVAARVKETAADDDAEDSEVLEGPGVSVLVSL